MRLSKRDRRTRIKNRIRKIISGTGTNPRLSVFRSNKEIYAQLIDDSNGKIIVASSSRDKNINKAKANKIDSWAYVWLASVWNCNGLTIIPNKNLILNIGFNKNATNTIN